MRYFPLVALTVFICCRFLDAWIAIHVHHILKSSSFLHSVTSDIPDILFILVCFLSTLLWSRYVMLKREGILNVSFR